MGRKIGELEKIHWWSEFCAFSETDAGQRVKETHIICSSIWIQQDSNLKPYHTGATDEHFRAFYEEPLLEQALCPEFFARDSSMF